MDRHGGAVALLSLSKYWRGAAGACCYCKLEVQAWLRSRHSVGKGPGNGLMIYWLTNNSGTIRRDEVNRPGIFGGSNSEVNWSHDEQDNEQIQP